MELTISLVLLIGTVVVNDLPRCNDPSFVIVPTIRGKTVMSRAMKQFTDKGTTAVATTPTAVTSIVAGLPYVRKIAMHPIVAATETEGWYVYATSVARNETTGRPEVFISGFAIKKGSREIKSWGVW